MASAPGGLAGPAGGIAGSAWSPGGAGGLAGPAFPKRGSRKLAPWHVPHLRHGRLERLAELLAGAASPAPGRGLAGSGARSRRRP